MSAKTNVVEEHFARVSSHDVWLERAKKYMGMSDEAWDAKDVGLSTLFQAELVHCHRERTRRISTNYKYHS